ncbi:uncharacterized protein LOC144562449 [Carex rostrata]
MRMPMKQQNLNSSSNELIKELGEGINHIIIVEYEAVQISKKSEARLKKPEELEIAGNNKLSEGTPMKMMKNWSLKKLLGGIKKKGHSWKRICEIKMLLARERFVLCFMRKLKQVSNLSLKIGRKLLRTMMSVMDGIDEEPNEMRLRRPKLYPKDSKVGMSLLCTMTWWVMQQGGGRSGGGWWCGEIGRI